MSPAKTQQNFIKLSMALFVIVETKMGGEPQPNSPLMRKLQICGKSPNISIPDTKYSSPLKSTAKTINDANGVSYSDRLYSDVVL
jgi:hypothetical protein